MLATLLLAALVTAQPVTAHRTVTTTISRAQRAFDRGLTDLYAYAGGGASTAFYEARAADPHLAMADWGDALAEGSDINTPLTELRFARAHDATIRALAARAFASPQEAALVDAVALRYRGTYGDRNTDERAYRDAMEKYVSTYPSDDDATMLLVEALLEDHGMQWNDDGTPHGDASKEMLALTNTVLGRNSEHLLANHLCIHLYDDAHDRSPAVPCARRLDAMTFAPQDEHLAHMPAHTWIERGDWRAAMASSERAYQLVAAWAAATGQDITAGKYLAHDEEIGAAAASIGGDRMSAARWNERLARFRSTPGPTPTLLSAARREEAAGNVNGAIAGLRRLLDWQHDNFAPEMQPAIGATELIGAVQFRAKRFADAEATFRSAVKERPLAPRPLFGLWQTLLGRGNTEEAAAVERSFRAAWAGQYPLTMNDF